VEINAHGGLAYRDDALIASLTGLNPAFVPGKSRKTLIFELEVGEIKEEVERKTG
jgi:hypothetical protein